MEKKRLLHHNLDAADDSQSKSKKLKTNMSDAEKVGFLKNMILYHQHKKGYPSDNQNILGDFAKNWLPIEVDPLSLFEKILFLRMEYLSCLKNLPDDMGYSSSEVFSLSHIVWGSDGAFDDANIEANIDDSRDIWVETPPDNEILDAMVQFHEERKAYPTDNCSIWFEFFNSLPQNLDLIAFGNRILHLQRKFLLYLRNPDWTQAYSACPHDQEILAKSKKIWAGITTSSSGSGVAPSVMKRSPECLEGENDQNKNIKMTEESNDQDKNDDDIQFLNQMLSYRHTMGKYPFDNAAHMVHFSKNWLHSKCTMEEQEARIMGLMKKYFDIVTSMIQGQLTLSPYDESVYELLGKKWSKDPYKN